MLSSWNKDIIIIIIIIIGVQKKSTSSWVVKILFSDVSMARQPTFSRVMRFAQSWRYNVTLAKTRNVALAKRERDVTRKLL